MPYNGEGNKHYDIQRVWGQQKEILRLVASGLYNNRQIAELVGVTPQTVSNVIGSALGKQTMEILQGAADSETVDLMVRIKQNAAIALSVQEDILLGEDAHLALKNRVADKMLDRAGYTPISKNLNLNANVGLSQTQIDRIKERAKELQEIKEAV